MSANRMFLVCKHHPSMEDALCIAERFAWDMPYEATTRAPNTWLQKHTNCGHGKTMDHFQLAMHRPADHDRPVQRVSTAVKLALVQNLIEEGERAEQDKFKGADDVEILD